MILARAMEFVLYVVIGLLVGVLSIGHSLTLGWITFDYILLFTSVVIFGGVNRIIGRMEKEDELKPLFFRAKDALERASATMDRVLEWAQNAQKGGE